MSSIFAILILLGIAWFWLQNLRSREISTQMARVACQRASVQFLDGTVAMKKMKLKRQRSGTMQIWRNYTFDFSDQVGVRRSGNVSMLGTQLENLVLDMVDEADLGTKDG